MSVIFLLIPLSILVAATFLVAFIWAVRSGQYDDTCTPSMRLLLENSDEGNETVETVKTSKNNETVPTGDQTKGTKGSTHSQ